MVFFSTVRTSKELFFTLGHPKTKLATNRRPYFSKKEKKYITFPIRSTIIYLSVENKLSSTLSDKVFFAKMGPDKAIIGLITWKFIQAIFLDKFKFSFLFYTKLFPLCTNKKKQKRLPTAWSQANAKNKIEWELWFPGKGIFMHSWLFYFNFGFLNNIKKKSKLWIFIRHRIKVFIFCFFLVWTTLQPNNGCFRRQSHTKTFFYLWQRRKKRLGPVIARTFQTHNTTDLSLKQKSFEIFTPKIKVLRFSFFWKIIRVMTSPTHFFFVAKNKRKFLCYFDGEKKTIFELQCGSNKKKSKKSLLYFIHG